MLARHMVFLPLADAIETGGIRLRRAKVDPAQTRKNRTRWRECSRKRVRFLELKRMAVTIPLKSECLGLPYALHGKHSRRRSGRGRIGHDVKSVESEIRHVFQRREGGDQLQVTED